MGGSRARRCVRGALLAVGVWATTASCGRWGFDATGDGGVVAADADADAGADADIDADLDAAPDAAADAAPPACTSGPFGPPALVSIAGLAPDFYGAKLSADGTRLYFSRVPGAIKGEDVYVATRSGPTSFVDPVPLDSINSNFQDGTPWVSVDGLTLLFSSQRPGGVGARDLYLATRPSTAAEFMLVRNLTELNSGAIDHTASMTADGLTIFFGTGREAQSAEDIYRASRASTNDPFGPPSKVIELSTSSFESSVFVAPDGLSVFFMSDRSGGAGCVDLWTASRASTGAAFSSPVPLAEANSSDCEDDPSLSADGCELFFSSDRGGNGYEIYRATRSP